MSVHSAIGSPYSVHPLDQPKIASKFQEMEELTAKIRAMDAVNLYCVSEEHDSGVGFGASTYTYTYYTNQEEANRHGRGDCFPMSAVRDVYRNIYEVSMNPTLKLTELYVKRDEVEKQLYEKAQKEMHQQQEKKYLLSRLAELQKQSS